MVHEQPLPLSGWLPDPVHAGMLRYRHGGRWTNSVLVARSPWGPERMVPPALRMPVGVRACVA